MSFRLPFQKGNNSVYSVDSDIFLESDQDPSMTTAVPIAVDPNVIFLPTMTQKLYEAYNNYCRKDVNVFAIFVVAFVSSIFMAVRLNFQNRYNESLFYISDTFFAVSFVLFGTNITPLVLKRFYQMDQLADKIDHFIGHLPFGLEDMTLYCCICCFGFNLVARVIAGKCPEDVTFWETQACTPQDGDVPSEMIMMMYITPIGFIVHSAIRSVSITGLIITWCLIVVFVTFCIVYNNAINQVWELFNSLFYMAMSFLVERNKRIAFLRLVELKGQKKLALKHMRNQHETETALTEQRRLAEIASMTATNERNLRVSETQQLRSLMGNVAHDLKTPLFSIEADVEFLKLLFNAIPPQAVQLALSSISQSCHGQNVDLDPATIFDSLWSTCRFMIAAINRGQDFAKASMNIALVPKQGTIDMCKTISNATRCVRHLLSSDSILVTHPFPNQLCDFIITDGLWLLENLLCLLSNAIKYSSSGEVSLTIELIQKGLEPTGAVLVRLDDDGIPITPSYNRNGSVIFSHRGSISVTTMVLVIVEDEGVGVSPEVRQTLFQPFKQAQRLAGGTGLGLFSLCKRVEALGGKCGCSERRDGKSGSLFWFTFPYRADDTALGNTPSRPKIRTSVSRDTRLLPLDTIDSTATSSPPSAFPSPRHAIVLPPLVDGQGHRKKKILLVDDTPSIIKVIGRLLQINGHVVDTAVNGHQALEKLKRSYHAKDATITSDVDNTNRTGNGRGHHGYDLVLSDLQMPVLDGLEFTKRFRVWEEEQQSILKTQGLPRRDRFLILGMSANSDEQTKQETMMAGMDHFMSKPFNYVDLEAILKDYDKEQTIAGVV